jgi:predicted nucleic acid-binding protein
VIILDTNVVSEVMLAVPEQAVLAWLDDQPAQSVWTTAITVFEIRHGLTILPPGRRRRALEEAFTGILQEDLDGRILGLDADAAHVAGTIAADLRRAGRTIEIRDALIAGIAFARKAVVATRNVKDFNGTGVSLVNPWAR